MIIEEDTGVLSQFLRKIVPYVEKQLEKNIESHAFDGKFIYTQFYSILSYASTDYQPYLDLETQYTVSLQHELTYSKVFNHLNTNSKVLMHA